MSKERPGILTDDEIQQYHQNGYAGPYRRFEPEEAVERFRCIEEEVFTTPGPIPGHDTFMRHMDTRAVYDLGVDPLIVDRLSSLVGPDLMIWNTSFWMKEAGSPATPWHQDIFYWTNDPPTNLTVWMAMTPCLKRNSCLRVIPGSHKKIVPHPKAPADVLFETSAQGEEVDEARALDVELQPGEFIIFNERLLHGSAANESDERRVGFAARFTLPFVKLHRDRIPLFEDHRAILVSGEDRFGFNQMAPPPED